MQPLSLNQLAKDLHAANATWWHDPATGAPIDRNRGELFALMHSELSEALEGMRKNLMDDHLPHRKMEEVELADTIIRLFDYSGNRGHDLDAIMGLMRMPTGVRPILYENRAECINAMHDILADAAAEASGSGDEAYLMCHLVFYIDRYCEKHSLDLWGAVEEKRAYNAQRHDHKPEARLSANGKKF